MLSESTRRAKEGGGGCGGRHGKLVKRFLTLEPIEPSSKECERSLEADRAFARSVRNRLRSVSAMLHGGLAAAAGCGCTGPGGGRGVSGMFLLVLGT